MFQVSQNHECLSGCRPSYEVAVIHVSILGFIGNSGSLMSGTAHESLL